MQPQLVLVLVLVLMPVAVPVAACGPVEAKAEGGGGREEALGGPNQGSTRQCTRSPCHQHIPSTMPSGSTVHAATKTNTRHR